MTDTHESRPTPPFLYEPPPWSAFWACELQRAALAILAIVAIVILSR